jgi:hypothetical protein
MNYYVKHRTHDEYANRMGYETTTPWIYEGPYSLEWAKIRWGDIAPNWQEGGVVVKCTCCDEYKYVK